MLNDVPVSDKLTEETELVSDVVRGTLGTEPLNLPLRARFCFARFATSHRGDTSVET
jgi:hypothetical protein